MNEKRWNILIFVLSSIAIVLSLTVLLMCRSLTNRLMTFVAKIEAEQEKSIDYNGYSLDSLAEKIFYTMGYSETVNSIKSYGFSFSDIDETNKTATAEFGFILDDTVSDAEIIVTYGGRWMQQSDWKNITAISEDGRDYTCRLPVKYSRPFTSQLIDPYYISVNIKHPNGRIEQITRTPLILRLESVFTK